MTNQKKPALTTVHTSARITGRDVGIPPFPTAAVDSHVIHGVEVLALSPTAFFLVRPLVYTSNCFLTHNIDLWRLTQK